MHQYQVDAACTIEIGSLREWHKTEGFREEALCLEASQRSYRDNTAHLKRYRCQPQGGTPVTTLQDNAQKEGSRVLNFLERYREFVQSAIPAGEWALIREALQRGQLTGTERFCDEIEAIIGGRIGNRKQGRPRKDTRK